MQNINISTYNIKNSFMNNESIKEISLTYDRIRDKLMVTKIILDIEKKEFPEKQISLNILQ